MDQEEKVDFKALRAKFQDEELLLKQPKIKPALPEKPKVVPPPQSPPHYLPAGARPSLLTSINQSMEGKTSITPRVVFKDEKKESKMPLIQTNKKDKSEGKLKKGKDKFAKDSKERLDEDSADQKQKNSKDKKFPLVLPVRHKESTAELVPAMPPPKATTTKRGFLGFKKSTKRDSVEITADSILDTPSSDAAGQAPLIPVPSNFGDITPEPETTAPRALLPNIPTLPDPSDALEVTLPDATPATPVFTPPPAFIPDIPAPEVPTLESETTLEIETPALPVSRPASQNEIIASPFIAVSTPPPSHDISGPPPVASAPSPSPPEPEIAAEAGQEAAVRVSPSSTPSPKAQRPISALSALERAEDMSPGKKSHPVDQRIFSALEKACRKNSSPSANPTATYSITPPPEELSLPQSPTYSLPDLPPIDYEDRGGNALLKPAQVNGFDHGQSSSVLRGVTEEGSDSVPELFVIPPPPPRKVLPDPESLGPVPEKPERPPSVNLSEFIPPSPLDDCGTHTPDFSETTDLPEFDDVASDAHSQELAGSDWGNGDYTSPHTPDGENLPEIYSNRITTPGAEVHAAPGDQDSPESSFPVFSQESPPHAEVDGQVNSSIYTSTENMYEDVSSATKKKGKTDGKKRKGPPKNPYAETQQETNEEKSKTIRFGKTDKKGASDGPDEKELKKKEKQRLEKEKKELKEKQEREKKEQKEREKKENEMKKKFKITGQEDAMYEAKVTVTTKGRKHDLPVKSGDLISIIRTTNCPKGKWLARDSSNNYGYVAVDHVELDIKEMLELGKKAASTRKSINVVETDANSTGSRASNHYPLSAESFTDDSEEWTGDDEPLSPTTEPADPLTPVGHTRTLSMPDMGNRELNINHQHSHSDMSADGSHLQARHEALQKLATFFHSPKPEEPAASSTEPETSPVLVMEEVVQLPEADSTEELDFDQSDLIILPPPELYAD